MPHIRLSDAANKDIVRFFDFLEPVSPDIAEDAITAIFASFDLLEQMPLSGVPVPDVKGLRKFVIDYGHSGYVAFYEYFAQIDTVVIAKIFHQKEKYTKQTLKAL